MMDILKTVQSLELPDAWVCAGFVRSKIWDTLHGFAIRTPLPDIDVIYYDPDNLCETHEKELENKLWSKQPHLPWSVKNEARMQLANKLPPYTSSADAMSKFPETVTALGVRFDNNNKVVLSTPCGVEDVLQMHVKPTPYFLQHPELLSIYQSRVMLKNWQRIWKHIQIFYINKTF